MDFEVIKTEGWGKLGKLNNDVEILTPNIIDTSLFKGSKNKGLSFECISYPSLQNQGKDINSIKSFYDLFPKDFNENHKFNFDFHIIPWDLPTIYLGNIKSYLEKIRALEIKENAEEPNKFFVVNIPYRKSKENIFELLKQSKLIKGVILGDISSFLTNPINLLHYIKWVNPWAQNDKIFLASGVPKSFIPLLSYLGIDIFDTMYLEMQSITNFPNLELLLELKQSKESFLETIHHTQEALRLGKLRDLVRIYANSFPPLKTILRLIDKELNLELGNALYTSSTLYCTDETDFTRPEVTRFRKRIKERYFPPDYLAGIIFLPCSAKKPYSQSRSHQMFQASIRKRIKRKRHLIHEVIITSPLGIVPRELEYTFPAAHYDIPVTGDWSEIERNLLKEDITNFLGKINPNLPIVGYVEGPEKEVLDSISKKVNRPMYLVSEDYKSLTSKGALSEFSTLLADAFENISLIKVEDQTIRFLKAIADFQFGKGVGKQLFSGNINIFGRKELGLRVKRNEEHLVTFNPVNGFLTLSLQAANLILDKTPNIVVFDGEKIIGSTIFSKGIIEANSEIRSGDEVIVLNSNRQIIGVGTSYLAGDLLVRMKKGKGISIRKKVK